MRAKVIKSGGSRTVRIPKSVWERSELSDDVDVAANPGRIVISSVRKPRHDWEKAFKRMATEQDDASIYGDVPNLSSWDATQWQW